MTMIAIYDDETGAVRGLQSWPVESVKAPHWFPTAAQQQAIESAVNNGERVYYLGGGLVTETDLIDKTVDNKAVRALTAEEITARDNALADEKRRAEYPPIPDQLDMIYWDQVNGTGEWQKAVKAVKDKYPKA